MIHYITTNGVSDAWVANELRIVHEAGIPFRLHAMRAGRATYFESREVMRLNESTNVLYPLPVIHLLASILLTVVTVPGRFASALGNALFGERESLRGRAAALAHLLVACYWARSLRGQKVSLIHAQWVHSSGTIGMYGAWLLGVPFSFTGHAADLFRDRVALHDKIRRSEFIVCISTFHRRFFEEHGAHDEQLRLAYCGIDIEQLRPQPQSRTRTPFRILSSGRLVEKKGFPVLIEACRRLAGEGLAFECVIAGTGPLYETLSDQIRRAGLTNRVRLTGQVVKQERLAEFMHTGDVYCLPCVPATDGDIDGLPQMLMEAMACGLPAISTQLVGIPDLIVDGRTGILVEAGHAGQLAEAIRSIYEDPTLADRLAGAGRDWVEERFDIRTCLEPLLEEFRKRLDPLDFRHESRLPAVDAAIASAGRPS